MGIGALENVSDRFQMVSDMKKLENKLVDRNYKGLNIQSMIFPNENHETVYHLENKTFIDIIKAI